MRAGLQAALPDSGRVRGDRFLPTDCAACGGRGVPPEGGAKPTTFLVGEAPGPQEVQAGRPFVGRAGKVLRRTLTATGWLEEDLWITNVVKSFPHEMIDGKAKIRRPTAAEIAACFPHLVAEAHELRPRMMVALGRTAAEALLGRRMPRLADVRGQILPARPELDQRPVFVTIHPSALSYGALRGTHAAFAADLRLARERAAVVLA